MKPLVYVAGPYTHPDPVTNTRKAIQAADDICKGGGDAFVPHLSLLWHLVSPQPVETWYERDLAVLRRCDALVRLPGPSEGADAEVVEACRIGLPVFLIWDPNVSDLRPDECTWQAVRTWLQRTTVQRQATDPAMSQAS